MWAFARWIRSAIDPRLRYPLSKFFRSSVWRGLLMSLTALATVGASPGSAQQAPSRAESVVLEREGFVLQQNYPNPFEQSTEIPFHLSDGLFAESGGSAIVTVRIYNIITNFVASPVAVGHPGGENQRLVQLEYTRPGRYQAHWDGRDLAGREVSSGIYILQLTVNGRTQTKKILVAK